MFPLTRRAFVTSVAVLPLQSFLTSAGNAEGLAKMTEQDPMATALGYRETSGTPEQTCANCSLYSSGAGAEWGQCAIFPGKLVAASGWCKSWVVKPA